MDKNLTLENASTTIKQAEQVRGQQDVLRNSEGQGHSGTTNLHAIYSLQASRHTFNGKPQEIRSQAQGNHNQPTRDVLDFN